MQELGTGYKPQWGLGAVLAALNDNTKEQFNQEDLLKSILANQREQQSMPLDMDIKAQEAQMARAKMTDPDYAKWALQNMIGQGKIVGAQGDIAQATLPQTIQNKQQDLRTSGLMGNLNEALAKLKQNALQGQGNGTIGFGMQPQQQQQPTAGFSWQIPQEVQQSRDADRLAILQEELKDNPTDQNLLRAIATTKSKVGTKAPAQSMQTDNPVYEQIMQSLMDTPEFRQKLMQQNERLESNEYMKQLALQAAAEKAKASGGEKPAKSAQEALVRDLNRRFQAGLIDEAQYNEELAAIFNRATSKQEQSGITATVTPNEDIKLGNKPNVAPYTPGGAKKQQQSDEDLIKKYLK